MATLTSYGILMNSTTGAIRNTTETFGTNIIEPSGQKVLIVAANNTLNQNMDVKVYGGFSEAFTEGAYLMEAATTVNAGTTGFIDIPLPSAFPYFKVSAKAGTNPTTGNIVIRANAA